MTEKELRKLNRYQLLDLLVFQTKRADELQEKVDALEARLNEQEINLSKLGSVAEAALQLGGVFDSAQKAADLYLENAKKQADKIVESAQHQAAALIRSTELQLRRRTASKKDTQQ